MATKADVDILTDRNASIAKDLVTAQEGLRNVYTILAAISSRTDGDQVFYEIGRAMGTSSLALTMSGGKQ